MKVLCKNTLHIWKCCGQTEGSSHTEWISFWSKRFCCLASLFFFARSLPRNETHSAEGKYLRSYHISAIPPIHLRASSSQIMSGWSEVTSAAAAEYFIGCMFYSPAKHLRVARLSIAPIPPEKKIIMHEQNIAGSHPFITFCGALIDARAPPNADWHDAKWKNFHPLRIYTQNRMFTREFSWNWKYTLMVVFVDFVYLIKFYSKNLHSTSQTDDYVWKSRLTGRFLNTNCRHFMTTKFSHESWEGDPNTEKI